MKILYAIILVYILVQVSHIKSDIQDIRGDNFYLERKINVLEGYIEDIQSNL